MGELFGCLLCIFILSLASVLSCKLAIKFQDNLRIVRFIVFGVWLAVVDQCGQGMCALAGAVKGHPDAQAQVGLHYLSGSMPGTANQWHLWWPKNAERGKFWLDKASRTGDPMADAVLADAYLEGDGGLQRDSLKAIGYLKHILDNNNAAPEMKSEAAFNLYQLYKEGDGIPANPGEATRYALIASDSGNGEAAYEMGKAFETGEIVPMDYGKAYIYYKKAVQNGNAEANGDYERLKKQLGQK